MRDIIYAFPLKVAFLFLKSKLNNVLKANN